MAGSLNLTHTSTALRSRHSILATSGALDLASLCVIPGKQCWVLYVDVLVCRPSSLSAVTLLWNDRYIPMLLLLCRCLTLEAAWLILSHLLPTQH